MSDKMNKIVNIVLIMLSLLLGISSVIKGEKMIFGIVFFLIFLFLVTVIYQRWIKNIVAFKSNNEFLILFVFFCFFLGIHLYMKSDILLILLQGISFLLFYFMMRKNFKNEKYIALSFLGFLQPVFIKSISSTVFLALLLLPLALLEEIDVTAYYRKKNFLIVTFSEFILSYLFFVNYHFWFFGLLYLIFLVKKMTLKPAIKISLYGVICFLLLGFFSLLDRLLVSNLWLIEESCNTFFQIVLISTVLYIGVSSFFKSDTNFEISLKEILLLLFITFFFENSIQYNIACFVTLSLLLCKKMDELPRIVNCKIKLHDKSSKALDRNDIKKISAVIPNYNYENYIVDRIDSILFQTYPISELIVLDDASSDNSIKVIEKKLAEVREKYPTLKIKFIPNQTNSGNVFKQWKKCFQESEGDYLWICEADDSCSPYFLENVMKAFDKDKNVVLSYSESLTMDENDKIMMDNLREWIDIFKTDKWATSFIENGEKYNKNYLVINNTIANVSGAVFQKKKEIPFEKYLSTAEEYKLAGDWYFYQRVLDHGKIAYCRKSLNYHRMHSSSVTLTTKREKEYEEICRIQDDIKNRYSLSKDISLKIDLRRKNFCESFGFSEEELRLEKIEWGPYLEKEKEEVLLSIIIPVYNTEPYLEKCLSSVFENLSPRTEVLLINDGSPDNSSKILKKYEQEYGEVVRYYKKTNSGLSDTKNFGILNARGKYIGFVDSDDYIKPNMFDVMLKKAILEDADIVYCDIELVYEDGTTRYSKTTNYDREDNLMKHLDTSLMPASWSKIVKKELFQNLDYPKGYNNEDIAVSPILFARSQKTVKIDSAFYKYFQRTGSIQNSGFSEKRFVAFYTANLCFERAKEFDKATQEKIKGSIYSHQLFSLLFYLIATEKNRKKRLEYIARFTEEINKFDDYDKNKYLIEYAKLHNRLKIFKYLRENKIKRIDFYLRTGI